MGFKIVINTKVDCGNFEFRAFDGGYHLGYIQQLNDHEKCVLISNVKELNDLKTLCDEAMTQIEKDRLEVEKFKLEVEKFKNELPPSQRRHKFLGIF
jgi:hypothetical protein